MECKRRGRRHAGMAQESTVFAGDASRTAIRHHRLDALLLAYVGFLFRCYSDPV